MRLVKRICIIILFQACILKGHSQLSSDIEIFKDIFHVHDDKQDYAFAKNISNELELISSSLFLGYKSFISSQDMASCVFYPSCSVYSIKTIKKNGFVIGIMDSFDRLTRCNGLSHENYLIHEETHLLYDPVE